MLAPSRRMSPVVGATKPAIMRSVVVLPQPEGPSSTISSPGWTSRLTASTALCAPNCLPSRSSARRRRGHRTTWPRRTKRSSTSSSAATATICATATAETSGSIWYSRYCSTATGSVVTPGLVRNSASSRFSNEMTKANSAAGDDAGAHRRQGDAPDHGQRTGAKAGGGLLGGAVVVGQAGEAEPHHPGRGDHDMRQHQPDHRAGDGGAELLVDRHQGDEDGEAEGDAGHRERRQQQGGDRAAAAEAMAREADAGGDAESRLPATDSSAELKAGDDRLAEVRHDRRIPAERVAARREQDQLLVEQAEIERQQQRHDDQRRRRRRSGRARTRARRCARCRRGSPRIDGMALLSAVMPPMVSGKRSRA